MLQIVLLAGKFVFLIILYLFIYRVVRSTTRELRAAAPVAEKEQWTPTPTVHPGDVEGAPVVMAETRENGIWTLVVQRSPCVPAGTAFAFPAGARALVGRSSDADIQLDDTFVSSKHVLFETTSAGLQVEDLRSTNGTQVNGGDISEQRMLQIGDQIEVGDTVFRVEVR